MLLKLTPGLLGPIKIKLGVTLGCLIIVIVWIRYLVCMSSQVINKCDYICNQGKVTTLFILHV